MRLHRNYISTPLIFLLSYGLSGSEQVGHFKSKTEPFSADYPTTWSQVGSSSGLGASTDKLDIVSFPDNQRAEAVVIKPGGAEIILERGSAPEPESGAKVLERKTLQLESSSYCSSTLVVRVLTPLVEGQYIPSGKTVYEDVSTYDCSQGTQHFVLILRHFKGDKNHESYDRAAKMILKSIRSTSINK